MYVQFLQSQLISGLSHWQTISLRPEQLVLKVVDAQGRLAKTIDQPVALGTQQHTVDLSDLLSGNYVVDAFSGDHLLKSFRLTRV